MRYFRRSLTIILMLLTSWIFIVSHAAVADMGDSSISQSMQHEFSFCDDGACSMSSGMSCFQHCDHQSVIPIAIPVMPEVSRSREIVQRNAPFFLNQILRVELKPPQHLILEIV